MTSVKPSPPHIVSSLVSVRQPGSAVHRGSKICPTFDLRSEKTSWGQILDHLSTEHNPTNFAFGPSLTDQQNLIHIRTQPFE